MKRFQLKTLLVGASALAIASAGFAQYVPSGGQSAFVNHWFTQGISSTGADSGSLEFSGDGSRFATRVMNVGRLTIEVYRTSDNSLVSSINVLSGHDANSRVFGLNSDGRYLAIASFGTGNERVYIFDVDSGSRVAAIDASWGGGTSGATAVAFSPNSTGPQYLAVGVRGSSPGIRLYSFNPDGGWNFNAFTQLGGSVPAYPHWIAWSNDGSRVAAVLFQVSAGSTRVWDVSNPSTPLSGFGGALGSSQVRYRVWFNNAGTELVAFGSNVMRRFSVPGGGLLGTTGGLSPWGFGYNADGSKTVGGNNGLLRDFDFGLNLTYSTTPGNTRNGAVRLGTNHFLVSGATIDTPSLGGSRSVPFNTYTFGDTDIQNTFLRTGISGRDRLSNMLVSSNGSEAFVAKREGSVNRVLRINAATGQITHTSSDLSGLVSQISFNFDRTIVLAGVQSATGSVAQLFASDLSSAGPDLTSTPSLSQVRGVVTVPVGSFVGHVVAVDANSRITIWDASGAQVATGVPSAGTVGPLNAMPVVTPDGLHLYFSQDEFVRKVALSTTLNAGSVVSSLNLGAGNIGTAFAVSPDGRRLALVQRNGTSSITPRTFNNGTADTFASPIAAQSPVSVADALSVGVTWMSNDYYAVVLNNGTANSILNNIRYFASETPVDLGAMTATLAAANVNYDRAGRSLYFSGLDGNLARAELPNTPVYIVKPITGDTIAWELYGPDVISNRSLGGTDGWNQVLKGDFNGDGREDLLWHNPTTQRTAVWTMFGTRIIDARVYSTGSWVPVATGDMNGNGNSDLLFQNGSQMTIWFMDGARAIGAPRTFSGLSNWEIRVTGDLNGNGIDDIVWKHKTQDQIAIWMMNSQGLYTATALYAVDPGLSLDYTGDVNGDGRADLIFRNGSNGSAVWLMNGTTVLDSTNFIAQDVELQGIGDLDRDGKTDMVLIDTVGGIVFAYQNIASGSSFNPDTVVYGTNIGAWRVDSVIDLNKDGKADLLWRNFSSNQLAVWILNGQNPLQSALLANVLSSSDEVIVSSF
jgi:hypothetical protein